MVQYPTARQLLFQLGLASLDHEQGDRVVKLFSEIVNLRASKRISDLVGTSWAHTLSTLQRTTRPDADQRTLEALRHALPEYEYYVVEEIRATTAEFVARLQADIADEGPRP